MTSRFTWNITQQRLNGVQVFSIDYTQTEQYVQSHPNTLFVRYDDYRFLERMYEELLKQVKRRW